MKKTIVFIMVLILSVCGVSCGKSNDREGSKSGTEIIDKSVELKPLVSGGVSEYKIVIPEDSSECIKYAGEELSSFIYQSSSVSIPIVTDTAAVYDDNNAYISVGKTKLLARADFKIDYESLNIDGYIIKTVGNMVFIDGNLERATLYGVYSFLERFIGVRFLTADCTYVPKNTKVLINKMDIIDIPDFPMRLYLSPDTYANWSNLQFCARTKQDTLMAYNFNEKYGENTSFYLREADHNMRFFVDESIYNDPNKPETYHPEFYVEHPTLETTLCLTNGITEDGKLDYSMDLSVAKIVIEEMKKDILANPHAYYFGFEQEDGQTYCECERCLKDVEKYKRSGVLVRFCNVMIEELEKWAKEINLGRDFNIVTFAYSYTADPPVKVVNNEYQPIDDTVIARPSLVIRKADSYNCCYDYFSDNQPMTRVNSNKNWHKCASNFMFWLHDKDFYDYLSYYPNLHTLKDNVNGMYDFGVTYAFIQGAQNGVGDWQTYMRGYIYRNLLWDMDLDVWDLATEFIKLYFGEVAAPYIEQLVTDYEINYKIGHEKYPNYSIETLASEYINPEKGMITTTFLENMIALAEKAEEAVNNDSNYTYQEKQSYLKRIASVKCTPLGTLWRNYYKFYPSADETDFSEFLGEFIDLLEYANVFCLRETDLVAAYKKSIGQ